MSQYPTTVEAIAIRKTGGLEVLEKMSLPFPKVEPDHIVIKLEYLGVNFIDTYYRQGLYKVNGFPAIIGTEAAGTIVGLPTDLKVLEDPAYQKRRYTIGGKVAVDFMGSHVTYVSIPWLKVFPVPASMSSRVAAACLVSCLTAVSFFEEAYQVKKGDVILIHTVAGSLGLIMCQLAKHVGATVIGTTSTKEKAEIARANGADHVILYPVENTVERVLELTCDIGVDAVFDGVGKDTFDANLKLLKRKGTLVSVGNASGPVAPFSVLKLMEKNLKLLRPTMSNYMVDAEETHHYGKSAFELVAADVLKVSIFKEYPFTAQGARDAQKDLKAGKSTGKLLIKID
ncbi:hypothetical protein C8J56DRAFT_920787 [Mycena floridula]|nr:hypothetical protein C8J56DRAFT_920787 [Mycena floridula]